MNILEIKGIIAELEKIKLLSDWEKNKAIEAFIAELKGGKIEN